MSLYLAVAESRKEKVLNGGKLFFLSSRRRVSGKEEVGMENILESCWTVFHFRHIADLKELMGSGGINFAQPRAAHRWPRSLSTCGRVPQVWGLEI